MKTEPGQHAKQVLLQL